MNDILTEKITNTQNAKYLLEHGYEWVPGGAVAFKKRNVNIFMDTVNKTPFEFFKVLVQQLEERLNKIELKVLE